MEGENAITTTFAKEPILSYSASQLHTLQLNQTTPLQGGEPFFADYAFLVDQPGTYELWYGGTPPGPADDLLPSYSSPFAVQLDDGEPRPVHQEDVVVGQEYTPLYHWVNAGRLELSAGQHIMRFLVSERRRFDNRFLFYLDVFFLIRVEDGAATPGAPLPSPFPAALDGPPSPAPGSIGDYERAIRSDSQAVAPLMELGQIYSLLGDYINAIKYFRRALLLDNANNDALLWLAKNRLWRSDVGEGGVCQDSCRVFCDDIVSSSTFS